MDNVTEAVALKVVEELTESNDLFTAYDVTTLLRARGVRVRHTGNGGVRDFVHNLFTRDEIVFANYNRDLHTLPDGTSVFVFCPYKDDPDNYDPNQHRNTNSTSTPAVQTPTVPVTATTTVDDGKVGTDQRGRLCVRADILRKLGVGPGDIVSVNTVMHSVVASTLNRDLVEYRQLVVDKDNCLRLSDRILYKMFGDPTPDLYELTFETNHLGSFIKIA